jgi:Transposase DDE domain
VCYRFVGKLRHHEAMLTACIERVIGTLREAHPEMGQTVAIDGSDMPAYANGHKYIGNKNGPLRTRFADPDAGWGHRSSISTRKGGAFYGYKLHMAICAQTELPLAWTVGAANDPERSEVASLLDMVTGRRFAPGACVMDKGYDGQPMHDVCESRNIRPVIALAQTPPSRPASTSRRRASTASGPSPGPTPSGRPPSGGARPASASPRPSGSRRPGCTR